MDRQRTGRDARAHRVGRRRLDHRPPRPRSRPPVAGRWLSGALALALLAAACSADSDDTTPPEVTVVATGLLNPVGLAALPAGGILIAEEGTGEDDESAGVSVLQPDGTVRRVVSNLPSGRDSGDLSGVPLVGVSPDAATAYLGNFGAGHLWTFPLVDGDVPRRAGPLTPPALGTALEPLNEVRLVNPFDITFDPAGVPVVSDASGNGVATANPDGTTRFIHRFGELTAPEQESMRIDAVPTGIERVGDEYYVTLTGGCPYPEESGQLVAIGSERSQRTVVAGLNMPIDVAAGPDGTVWVLEFARFDPDASCFTGQGYRSGTGRLSRLDGNTLDTVLDDLDYPGAVLPMADGSLYVTEIFAGRVLHLTFGEAVAQPPTPTAPAAEAEENTMGFHFEEAAADLGIDFRHGAFRWGLSSDPVAAMGGGVCWLDYDADGRLDLYLVNSHSLDEVDRWDAGSGRPRNALYRNTGNGFVDMSAGSGADLALRGNGCVAADFDGDGAVDVYVTADGPNALLMNNGDGTFREAAEEAGVAVPDWSTAALAGDIDGDGNLDLYVAAYIDLEKTIPKPSGAFPQDYLGVPDRLFLGDGTGGFREATAEAALGRSDRTLGGLFSDVDGDGDLDLYAANDGNPNRMYVNETVGPLGFRLLDATEQAGVGDSGSGMGVAGGDYDQDGGLDLLVTNWDRELNALYRNEIYETGVLEFQYSTFRIGLAGLGNGQTGWGTAWGDFDHDTDLDLLIVNGRVPISDPDTDAELIRLYRNLTAEGERGQFRDWTEDVGLADVGPLMARGAAVADFDDDGDLDVAVNVIGGNARLLRSEGSAGNWLTVVPSAAGPGTTVTVVLPDGRSLIRESHAGSSYLSTEDPRLHFGLGDFTNVRSVTVRWPDGAHRELVLVEGNQFLEVGR